VPRTIVQHATVVLPESTRSDCSVLFDEQRILRVWPSAEPAREVADEVVDASGLYLAPGLIDLHFHGVHRHRVDTGPDDLAAICEVLPQYGLTGLLPCVAARPKGEDARFVASLARVCSAGAEVLGFHMEGPFLGLPGAGGAEGVSPADADRAEALIDAAKPYRTVFSVAPELEGILDLIPIMARDGTPVFMTHTAADVTQTQAAIEAGARHATHFYDVFPCPPVADPGVRPCGAVEAVLADPRVSVDFILDGEHVDPIAVKVALECKGPEGVCLITDSNIGAGLPPGRYAKLFRGGEIEFAYPGGPARRLDHPVHPGCLSGSGLTLDRAVRNAVRMLGVGVPQALRMAGASPARVLGLDDRKGHVRQGYDADLILLDEELNVKQTWVGGVCRFKAG